MAKRPRRSKRARQQGTLPTLFALLFFLSAFLYYQFPRLQSAFSSLTTESRPVTSGVEVHFLDVGQGDSTLLISGGETLLIDGSTREAGETVIASLEALGVEEIDYLVATHAHEDHIGGLPDVMERFPVSQCWMSDDVADTKIYDTFLTCLEEYQVEVTLPQVGDSFSFGDCTATVLAPIQVSDDHNNNSLVLKVTCGDTSFLFTGDMETEEEADLLASRADLSADVLKVAHHGSAYTTSMDFLQRVQPQVAVISCGADNSYGHPHQELVQRLEYLDIPIYRTDLQGTITIYADGTEMAVSAERGDDVS